MARPAQPDARKLPIRWPLRFRDTSCAVTLVCTAVGRPPPDVSGIGAEEPAAEEDVLEWIEFYPPRQIVLRTKQGGFAYYRTLFVTGTNVAKRLVEFLDGQVGRTVKEIGDAEISL